MDPLIKYLPPMKKSFVILMFILFCVIAVVLFYFYTKYKILAIIVFSLFYGFFMITSFIFMTQKFFMQLHEDQKTVEIHKPFSSHIINLNQVIGMELFQTKRSYILSVTTKEQTKHYTLTGSLSFEEPLLVPFLRKMQAMEPNINLGEFMHNLLHGSSNFDPWSVKMYYAYYSYILSMIGFYIGLLLFIYILR
ncbi:hypothetical protein ACFL0C_01760 [Patescibacteria group bacterium]